jgi:hypothetical protein
MPMPRRTRFPVDVDHPAAVESSTPLGEKGRANDLARRGAGFGGDAGKAQPGGVLAGEVGDLLAAGRDASRAPVRPAERALRHQDALHDLR